MGLPCDIRPLSTIYSHLPQPTVARHVVLWVQQLTHVHALKHKPTPFATKVAPRSAGRWETSRINRWCNEGDAWQDPRPRPRRDGSMGVIRGADMGQRWQFFSGTLLDTFLYQIAHFTASRRRG